MKEKKSKWLILFCLCLSIFNNNNIFAEEIEPIATSISVSYNDLSTTDVSKERDISIICNAVISESKKDLWRIDYVYMAQSSYLTHNRVKLNADYDDLFQIGCGIEAFPNLPGMVDPLPIYQYSETAAVDLNKINIYVAMPKDNSFGDYLDTSTIWDSCGKYYVKKGLTNVNVNSLDTIAQSCIKKSTKFDLGTNYALGMYRKGVINYSGIPSNLAPNSTIEINNSVITNITLFYGPVPRCFSIQTSINASGKVAVEMSCSNTTKIILKSPSNEYNDYTYNGGTQNFILEEAGQYSFEPYNEITKLYGIESDVKVNEISYNANGGSGTPSSQIKPEISYIILSSTKPTMEGYSFIGWNTKADGSGEKTYQPGDTYTGSTDLMLYAQWEEKAYTVTYDANGGSGAPANQTKTYGVNLTLSTTYPSRTGYSFQNWNTEKNGTGSIYQAGGLYTKDENLKLYAQWKADTYTVTYDANDGSGAPANQTKTYGVNLTLSTTEPTRIGYTFKGWATSSSATTVAYQKGSTYATNAPLKLYAVWEANTYTISYNANGGNGAPTSQTKTHDQSLKLSTTQPSKNGYTFNGWATSNTATSATYQAGATYTTNASVTLYAVWKANTSTVTFDPSDGSVDPTSKNVTYNGTYGTLPTPIRSGYTFNGWYTAATGGTVVTSQTNVTIIGNHAIYAHWTKVASTDNSIKTITIGEKTPSNNKVTVSSKTSSVSVVVEPSDSNATVKINTKAGTSQTVSLNPGTNTITVVVTSESGEPKTYTYTVVRSTDEVASKDFVDNAFYKCVVSSYDGTKDYLTYEMTLENLGKVSTIVCNPSGVKVTDTTGLEKMLNITELDLHGNEIEGIDLSKHEELKNVKLSVNENLEVVKLASITYNLLELSHCNLTRLDLRGVKSKETYLSGQNITLTVEQGTKYSDYGFTSAGIISIYKAELGEKVENITDRSAIIGTGSYIEDEFGNNKSIYTFLVYGDVNGDGEIKASDYVIIRNHLMNVNKLSGVYEEAADYNKDNEISASDYVLIRKYIMSK